MSWQPDSMPNYKWLPKDVRGAPLSEEVRLREEREKKEARPLADAAREEVGEIQKDLANESCGGQG